MDFLIVMLKTLTVLVVLSVLIIVHEWGHFITARKLGIRVEKFSIGFGKKIFSRKKGNTEYMLSAIPLGGYVKLAGDERDQCQGKPDEFYARPIGHRALVVLMGPVVNFVFAYVCFYLIAVTGFPLLAPKIGNIEENKPAHHAGFVKNDYIFAINGHAINSWQDIQDTVRKTAPKQALHVNIRRDGQVITATVIPESRTITNMFGKKEQIPLIGIEPADDFVLVPQGLVASFAFAWRELVKIPILTFKILYHIIAGDVPAKGNVGGPILIGMVIWEAVRLGLTHVVYVTAIISASLAIINLFPFPVLDGGHILFMFIEKIRGRPISAKLEEILMRVGTGAIILLALFVFYNDLSQLEIVQQIRNFFTPGTTPAP